MSDELPAPFSLTGRVAFATGASSGIGRHFSQLLARSGASVVLPAHRHDRLEALRREIESASERAVSVALEVMDRQSVEAGFAFAAEALGPIDILVNNAEATEPHPFLDMTEEAWRFVIETDLTGVWSVAQVAARGMAAGRGDSIINFASALGGILLLVRNGFDAVCLDRVVSPFPIRTFTVDIGGKVPLGNCTWPQP